MPRTLLSPHRLRWNSRTFTLAAGALGGVLAITAASAIWAGSESGPAGPRPISVAASGCARHWSSPRAGTTTFQVSNSTASEEDVALLRGPITVAELPTLGPGVARPVVVTLNPGDYQWVCTSLNGAILYSPRDVVTGAAVADPSPGFQPLLSDQLGGPVTAYRTYVTKGLEVLDQGVRQLAVSAMSGDRQVAERYWLAAHLDYARLGAAYGTFGIYADRIDGRADGLVGGVSSPRFTGFLSIEYSLWHHRPMSLVATQTAYLEGQVKDLISAWPHQLFPVTDLPLRAHEILENALQFELTADTNEGSDTNLATVRANVQGTTEVVSTLEPLLASRDPELSVIEEDLTSFSKELSELRTAQGQWPAVTALPILTRETLDAHMDGLLALLDQIPADLEVQIGGEG